MSTSLHAPIAVGLDEAARMSGLSRRSIEHLTINARIPSRKVGRRRLILVVDLEWFLRAQRTDARSTAKPLSA